MIILATVHLPWQKPPENRPTLSVWDKVPLSLDKPKFSYKTVKDKPKIASVPKLYLLPVLHCPLQNNGLSALCIHVACVVR